MFNGRWWTQSPKDAKVDQKDASSSSSKSRDSNVEYKLNVATLKLLYSKLVAEPTINDGNSAEIVSTLKNISEILIWGDKNDPAIFEYFLEKQMLQNFLTILNQCGAVFSGEVPSAPVHPPEPVAKPSLTSLRIRRSSGAKQTSETSFTVKSAHHVCIQVLQLLNILFENISQETSLYFLLSNNFINRIVSAHYDFADEEILAHYISLVKILSAKLNQHTIHFFHCQSASNETDETSDDGFPLFSRALGLFTHEENMVRIASRTIILNILRVKDPDCPSHSFIRSKELPSRLLSLLCTILNDHVARLRSAFEEVERHRCQMTAEIFPEDQENSADLSLTRTRCLYRWSKLQKVNSRIKDITSELIEYIQYVNDLLELEVEPLSECVKTQFRTDFLLPCVLQPIMVISAAMGSGSTVISTAPEKHLELIFSLFLLNILASNVFNWELLTVERLSSSLMTMMDQYGSSAPQLDDRVLIFLLLLVLNLSRSGTPPENTSSVDLFLPQDTFDVVVRIMQAIAEAGYSVHRHLALKLSSAVIEAHLGTPSLLTEAVRETVSALKKTYSDKLAKYRTKWNFVELVELESQQRKQERAIRPDSILEREVIHILAFMPTSTPLEKQDIGIDPPREQSAYSFTQNITEERDFPELSKRFPLSIDEAIRYYLKGFFTLKSLCSKLSSSKISSESTSDHPSPTASQSFVDPIPAPVTSLQVNDIVDISSCDAIMSATIVPFHAHLANRSPRRSPTGGGERPQQLLLCPSDEEKWTNRFLIIHQWQMLLVEPDSRKAGFAVVKESYGLPNAVLLTEKEQRERIICCCSLANGSGHRNHDVNPSAGIDAKTVLKSIFVQIEQPLTMRISKAPNDAPWNAAVKYDAHMRIVFDDSIRARAALTRIKKNQDRIRELKLTAIEELLGFPKAALVQNHSHRPSLDATSEGAGPIASRPPRTVADSAKAGRRQSPFVIHTIRSSLGSDHSLADRSAGVRDQSSAQNHVSRTSMSSVSSNGRNELAGRSGHVERIQLVDFERS